MMSMVHSGALQQPLAHVCATFDVGALVQGLRATKAVLRVAGSLKRAEPKVDEDRILMRGQAQKTESGCTALQCVCKRC